MHTLIVRMALDPSRSGEVDRHFRDDVVLWAKAQPGFVTGRWLRSTDGASGLGVVTFSSLDAATAAVAGPAWTVATVEVFQQVEEA
jgi:hypothetical protein